MADAQEDDARLMRLIAVGRIEALDGLYDRYHRLVFSLALAVLGDPALAGEVVLDVFTRVWQRAGSYHAEQGKVTTWLTAVTRHHAIDLLRRRRARVESRTIDWDQLPPQATAYNLEEHVELRLQRERVRAAVALLSPEQQQVLTLAYFKGYSHHEIAELLGLPLGTVKSRIRSAIQKLRQTLKEE